MAEYVLVERIGLADKHTSYGVTTKWGSFNFDRGIAQMDKRAADELIANSDGRYRIVDSRVTWADGPYDPDATRADPPKGQVPALNPTGDAERKAEEEEAAASAPAEDEPPKKPSRKTLQKAESE